MIVVFCLGRYMIEILVQEIHSNTKYAAILRCQLRICRHLHRLIANTRHAIKSVCRESRQFSEGANPTRPIGRSAGSNQIDSQHLVIYSYGRETSHQTTLLTHPLRVFRRPLRALCSDSLGKCAKTSDLAFFGTCQQTNRPVEKV